MKNVLLISGSGRKKSMNTYLLNAFAREIGERAKVSFANIDLPLYNQDLESDFPASATALKEQIATADVVIIASPEYNRGYTPAIKNAVDWASRPYGENVWQGKTVIVTSAVMGTAGGALGVYQLKQVLLHLRARVAGTEFFVAAAHEKFDEAGVLTDESTREHVAKVVSDVLDS